MKYYHKVIVIDTDGDPYALAMDTEEMPSLMDALVEVIFVIKPEEVLFAGTCQEEDLEFFGNDQVEWEEGEDVGLEVIEGGKSDDDILH